MIRSLPLHLKLSYYCGASKEKLGQYVKAMIDLIEEGKVYAVLKCSGAGYQGQYKEYQS